jgi:hypothetical protein
MSNIVTAGLGGVCHASYVWKYKNITPHLFKAVEVRQEQSDSSISSKIFRICPKRSIGANMALYLVQNNKECDNKRLFY